MRPSTGAAEAWGTAAAVASRASDQFAALAEKSARASELAYAADLDLKVREKRIELYNKHRDNPEGFEREYRGFEEGILGGVDLRFADRTRRVLDDNRLDALNSIYNNKFVADKARATDSVKARLGAAETDVLGHAYRGGVGSPQYQQATRDYQAYLAEGVAAGLWSQDHADIQLDRLASKAKGEFIVGTARRLYEQYGAEGAFKEAERLLGELPGLDPREVESYRGRAAAEIGKLESFRTADLAQLRAQASEVKARLDAGVSVPDSDVDLLVAQLAAKGGGKEAADLGKARLRFDQMAVLATMPLDQHAAVIQNMRTQTRPLVDRISNAEWNPNGPDKNPNSSATGPLQFIDSTWLETIRKHAPDVAAGKSDADLLKLRTDPATARRMGEAYIKDNRATLEAAGLPTDDGALYLAHFAGVGGASAVLSSDPSTPIRTLMSADAMKANAGIKLGGKPFADFTAADLRTWAAGKVAGRGVDPEFLKDAEAALTRKREALNNDPLRFAATVGVIPQLPAVDWSQPEAAKAALQQRQHLSLVTAANYKLGTVPVFDRAEIDQIRNAWGRADSSTRARILGTLAESLDADHLAVTTEKFAGDLPELAWAANLHRQNQDIATSIVRGATILETQKGVGPSNSADFRAAVDEYLGTAMSRTFETRHAVLKAALAHYADVSAQAGNTSGIFDQDRLERAIDAVTGGVVTWRGQKLIAPQYGMTTSGFRDVMDSLTAEDLQGAQTPKGTAVTSRDILKMGTLHNRQNGQFSVVLSVVLNDNVPVLGPDGRPFVLDLSQKKPPTWADRPLMDDDQRRRERELRESLSYLRQEVE